ncbi:Imm41 family immunity protein [Pasteurella testudinis]|uniref:Imm41 family immunity protein n=1 Tax=Pasteurella testudinis TaxID=761 RepID=UPI0040597A14
MDINKFEDFRRNIPFLSSYDEGSFIGRWLDYSEWVDDEYWLLEKDLIRISFCYRKEKKIDEDILNGIMKIAQLMLVPNWSDFSIVDLNDENSNIYDRFDRLKFILGEVFSDRISVSEMDNNSF